MLKSKAFWFQSIAFNSHVKPRLFYLHVFSEPPFGSSGLPWWLSVKTLLALQTWVSIPGLGRFPGEGNGKSFQSSCLGNIMDSGAWWAVVMGLQESDTTEWLAIIWRRSFRCEWCQDTYWGWLMQLLCIEWITLRTYRMPQGTLLGALWWPKWEGNPEKRGYM